MHAHHFGVNILADSIPCADQFLNKKDRDKVAEYRLITFALRAPRTILAEFNTHRAASKSVESSRAIPTADKIAQVRVRPFCPGDLPDGQMMGNNAGMVARTPLSDTEKIVGQKLYRDLASTSARVADQLAGLGWHKQDVNRILEAFSSVKIVMTTTMCGLINMFGQRCDENAYPPFRFLARCMYVALQRSTPKEIPEYNWHLPYITDDDWEISRNWEIPEEFATNENMPKGDGFLIPAVENLIRWSVSRCCRVSYSHFGSKAGKIERDKDEKTYFNLVNQNPIHISPMEHQATWESRPEGWERSGNKHANLGYPWIQFRSMFPNEIVSEYNPSEETVKSWNIPDDVFDTML